MATIEELERRLTQMDQLTRELVATLAAIQTKRHHDDAEKLAISEMLILLATRAGLSRDEFVIQFDDAVKRSLDSIMRQVEDSDPWIAAMLDDRNIEDILDSTDDSNPPKPE